MGRSGRKASEFKQVSFRTPADLLADYVRVAAARGVDLTSLFNWALAEYRPVLLRQQAAYEAAMRAVAAAPIPPADRAVLDAMGVGVTDRAG